MGSKSDFRKGTLLLFFLLLTGIQTVHSAVFTANMVATPINKTCYSGALAANYIVTVGGPQGYVYGTDYTFTLSSTNFKLRTALSGAGGTVLISNTGGTTGSSTISGSFNMSALAPDIYTIYATITIYNIRDSVSQVVQTTSTFTVGYEAVWAHMLDMQALPNNYSCKRVFATGGVTYAAAISANTLGASGDGWMELGAQFGGNTGSVYVLIGKSTPSSTVPPSDNYIEFKRTGASTGSIIVKSGSTTTLSGLTFSDRILMRRSTGNTLKFYKSSTGALISGSPTITGVTGELNVGVFAANSGDGLSNTLTSFSCIFENQFYYLKNEVEQSIAYVSGSKLRFRYSEDYYDNGSTLTYSLRCLNDDALPTPVTVTKNKHTNWVEITLGSGGVAVTNGNIYLLEATDSKGRKQYLKFKKVL